MKRNLKVLFGSLIIVCVCLVCYFYSNHQQIRGLNSFPESGAKTYVYSRGCFLEKEDYTQIDPVDYESLLQLVSMIKYMNPKIDPVSIEYIVYGGSGYEFEIIYEDTIKTFSISCNELQPNVRRVILSDGKDETYIAAYVKDDVYKEYERLAKKYLNNGEDS